jgi:hypothetical protein
MKLRDFNMTNFWDKYKNQPNGKEIIKDIAGAMMSLSVKYEAEYWKKELAIYNKYGVDNLIPMYRKQISKINEEKNHHIHPLWVQISEIYSYLTSK